VGNSAMLVTFHMQANPSYDPIKDFTPIVKFVDLPVVLVAPQNAPFSNLKEMMAYAKANPRKLSYATSGKGAASHLAMAILEQAEGVEMVDAPYKSAGQAMTDVIGGQVSGYFPALPSAIPHIRAGRLKGIAIGAPKRSSELPNVPTIAESLGKPGLEVLYWVGLLAPAGVPKEVVAKLHAATLTMNDSPERREKISKLGADVLFASPDQFSALLRTENAKYGKLIKSLGLKD